MNRGKKSKVKKYIKIFISVIILTGFITTISIGVKYGKDIVDIKNSAQMTVGNIQEDVFKNKVKTEVYDNNGNLIQRLSMYDYEYVDYKNINKMIENAVISIEDERFHKHNGIDYKAIARAGYLLVKNKGEITQGGSTITQQLVKNVILTHDRTFDRKISEIFIARELEKIYGKEKIMEFYLNNIYYGNNSYGIWSASKYYFGKDNMDLKPHEVATLIAIPNNPTIYDPIKNPKNNKKRRNIILWKMYELEFITEEDYKNYSSKEIELNITKREVEREDKTSTFVVNSATKILMETEGFKIKYAFRNNEEREIYRKEYAELFDKISRKIRYGGYKIYSTIDLEKQQILQTTIDNNLRNFTSKSNDSGLYETQGSGVVINNETGDLVALVGGRTQNVYSEFNRAYMAYRQPGSIIKPIVAFTPAFDKGTLGETKLNDSPIRNGPRNASRGYSGRVTARYALEKSLNTIPFRLVLNYTPEEMLKYLYKMEFSNITDEDKTAIIGIGGFHRGTTPLEMAGAYSTLAQNGKFIKPSGIDKIENVIGEVIYQNRRTKSEVYNAGAAYLTTDILKGVVEKPHGTGYKLGVEGINTAGKTGTTDGSKDGWFAGYTPYYTTVVWVGNDIPKSVSGLYGATYPGKIWKEYMDEIHKGLENKEFKKPSEIKEYWVNMNTGYYSSTPKSGWLKQLVPTSYIKFIDERERQREEERRKKEIERRKEEKRRKEILEQQKKEDLKIEEIIKEKLDEYRRFKGNTKQRRIMLENIRNDINKFKVSDNRNKYNNEINRLYNNILFEEDIQIEQLIKDKIKEFNQSNGNRSVKENILREIEREIGRLQLNNIKSVYNEIVREKRMELVNQSDYGKVTEIKNKLREIRNKKYNVDNDILQLSNLINSLENSTNRRKYNNEYNDLVEYIRELNRPIEEPYIEEKDETVEQEEQQIEQEKEVIEGADSGEDTQEDDFNW